MVVVCSFLALVVWTGLMINSSRELAAIQSEVKAWSLMEKALGLLGQAGLVERCCVQHGTSKGETYARTSLEVDSLRVSTSLFTKQKV